MSRSLRRVVPLLILCTFFALSSLRLNAQVFPQDIRLSYDVSQIVLPDDAQIQSAARIGDLTLAVWGSSRNVTDDSIANTLYYQLISGTTPLGQPRRLTDDRFDPFGFVQVLALDNHFLVVWNDRRPPTEQTWRTVIDTNGVFAEPVLFQSGHPLIASGIQKIRQEDGWFILWSDTVQNYIMKQKFDSTGTPLNVPLRLDSGYIANILFDQPEVGSVIIERGSFPPIIVGSDGSIKRFTGKVAEKFAGQYSIDANGSVLTIRGDTVFEYADVRDMLPVRQIPFQLPSNYTLFRATVCATRTAKGLIRIYFSACSIDNRYPGPEVAIAVFALEENDSSGFSDPIYISKISRGGYHKAFFSWVSYSGTTQPIGCNSFLMRIKCRVRSGYTYQMLTIVDTFSFNSSMVVGLGDTIGWYDPQIYPPQNLPPLSTLLASCNSFLLQVPVKRYPAKHYSQVIVEIDTTKVTVMADAAQLIQPISYRYPTITQRNDSLTVSFLSLGSDSMAVAGRWAPETSEKFVPTLSTSLDFPYDLPSPYLHITPYDLDGLPLIHLYRSELIPGQGFRSQQSLLLLRDTGWRRLDIDDGVVSTSVLYGVISAVQDPNDGTIFVASGWVPDMNGKHSADSITITAYSDAGDRLWNIDSLKIRNVGFLMVPIKERKFLGIGLDQRIYQFEGDSLLGSIDPPIGNLQIYKPYFGKGFVWAYDGEYGLFGVERRDIQGRLLHPFLMGWRSDARDYSFCFNPIDSGIVLLYVQTNDRKEGGDVVYMMTFDKNLMQLEDRVVNATPAAIGHPNGTFRNDTLFIVWENYRDGTVDIFANAVIPVTHGVGTPLSAVDELTSSQGLIASITPNPTHRTTLLRFNARLEASAHVELYNLLGQKMMAKVVPAGESETVLNVEWLNEGTYLVVVKGNGTQQSRMITILR